LKIRLLANALLGHAETDKFGYLMKDSPALAFEQMKKITDRDAMKAFGRNESSSVVPRRRCGGEYLSDVGPSWDYWRYQWRRVRTTNLKTSSSASIEERTVGWL